MKQQVVFIIPGFAHVSSQGEYKSVAQYFLSKGIMPVLVNITWKKKLPIHFEDYVEEFLEQTKKYRAAEVYIFGFSFGAIIALRAAKRLKPKAIILCSLSPYFLDDAKNLKKKWLQWWHKHYKASYNFRSTIRGLKTKVYLVAGSKEDVSVLKRAEVAHKLIAKSELVIVKGAKHELHDKTYLRSVKNIVSKMTIA